jgi:DNA polymerase-3 subunit chi
MSESSGVEIFFYHLQRQPLAAVLPQLVEKCLERGWRVVIQATSEERIAALDDHLWIYTDDSFVPHARDRDADAERDPVVLTLAGTNPNGAQVRFLVENAALPDDAANYRRIVVLFDGNDEDALALARATWRTVRESGYQATYWQQNDSGRWEKKA